MDMVDMYGYGWTRILVVAIFTSHIMFIFFIFLSIISSFIIFFIFLFFLFWVWAPHYAIMVGRIDARFF